MTRVLISKVLLIHQLAHDLPLLPNNMSSVDFSRYKRIMQAFWDPEPKNDDASGSCIWCLGKEYLTRFTPNISRDPESRVKIEKPALDRQDSHQDPKRVKPPATTWTSLGEREAWSPDNEAEKGWPSDFLDDCESRIWFTYRSNFTAIKKSSDASMTISVRLRSLGDQGGFTSDTGWGCMIRSGQSLLANALVLLWLGRGERRAGDARTLELINTQTGDEEGGKTKSDNYFLCFLMILSHLFRYIDLLNTVLRPVGSILESGSDHRPPQDVYSKS